MDSKGYFMILVVVFAVLCAGCIESVDYQPPNVVGGGNRSSNAGVGIGNASNATILTNITLPQNISLDIINSSLNSSNMNLTLPYMNTTIPTNATGNETAVNKTVIYGKAVDKGNSTYMFKINDQLTLSSKDVRVERIWPTSILIYVAGQNITEERKQIGIGAGERIFGLNITLVDVFYDSFADGRIVYIRIV